LAGVSACARADFVIAPPCVALDGAALEIPMDAIAAPSTGKVASPGLFSRFNVRNQAEH
jgi:hypothetical protein